MIVTAKGWATLLALVVMPLAAWQGMWLEAAIAAGTLMVLAVLP